MAMKEIPGEIVSAYLDADLKNEPTKQKPQRIEIVVRPYTSWLAKTVLVAGIAGYAWLFCWLWWVSTGAPAYHRSIDAIWAALP